MLLRILRARLRKGDDGFAMVAAVAFIAVMIVITALVATTVTSAQAQTADSKASVQSQSAAEAGIAAARAGLMSGTCSSRGGVYTSAPGEPVYTARIYTRLGTAAWSVNPSCPASVAVQVKIVSQGSASVSAIGRVNTGQHATVEVLLSHDVVSTSINPTGPAVYAYNSTGFGGGGRLLSEDGSDAAVMIKQGNVRCTGGASGASDLVVDNGNLEVVEGCNITGDAWVSGSVSMPGGPNIGGSVVASSLNISGGSKVGADVWVTGALTMSGGPSIARNATAGSLSISGGGWPNAIGGTAFVSGPATLTNFSGIGGNLTANSLMQTGGRISGSAWIYGATTFEWTANIQGSLTTRTVSRPERANVNGGTTLRPTGLDPSPFNTNGPAPDRPMVPGWVDFTFQAADWTGFTVIPISGSQCGFTNSTSNLLTAVQSLAGTPGVIDATACTNGVTIESGKKLPFSADLAIIAKRFNFTGGGGFINPNSSRLWLITPDTVDDNQPTCPAGSSFWLGDGFTVPANLDLMLYTPCNIGLASDATFHGQVYSGTASINGGSTLTYVKVGLPGVDLSTGASTSVSTTEADRVVVAQRNIAPAG